MATTNNWRRRDVDAVVEATSAKDGPLERAVTATEQIAGSSRAQVAIALDDQGGDPGSWPGGTTGDLVAPEQVVRSLTRWQGSDTTSLVRALRASFERTPVQGRSVLRYRGAGRVRSGAGSGSSVGPGARALRRITPGLQDVLDLLDRLEPVDPAADAVAVHSAATVVRDRLSSYAEELGRGFDARPARLRAIRVALRGGAAGALGGALQRLHGDLRIPVRAVTHEQEALTEDFLVLVDFVYALDGSPPPPVPGGAGPSQWREAVEDDLATLTDLLADLRTRLRVEGITAARLESRTFRVNRERQSVGDVLDWAEELVTRTAPSLLEGVSRTDAEDAIGAELAQLRLWVAQMRTLGMFGTPLLQPAVNDVHRGLRRLRDSLRRP